MSEKQQDKISELFIEFTEIMGKVCSQWYLIERMVEAQINKMNGLIDRKTAILMLLRESIITYED